MLALSVIICTRKPREDHLRRVLEALRGQTLPKDQWELLLLSVAADGPLSDRFDLSWHPNGRFILEEKLGKNEAFLRAVVEARGELLVIVDDDNVLRSDYLAAGLKIGEDYPWLGAWSGSYVAEFEVEPPSELAPWLAGALVTDRITVPYWAKITTGSEALPPGAGMIVRRKQALFYREQVMHDPVRSSLGPNNKPPRGCEDSDLALCAFALGLGTGRFPELELTHLIPARKLTLASLENSYESFGYGGVIMNAVHGKKPASPGAVKSGKLRFLLMKLFLLISRKSRVERRILLATERGRLRATHDLIRMNRLPGRLSGNQDRESNQKH